MNILTHRVTTISLLGAVLFGCGGGGGDGNENPPPAPAKSWGTAGPIEADDSDHSAPQIAMDADGNAIAVWTQTDGATRSTIEANRYVAGVGWETAGPIAAPDSDHSAPRIAMDADGNAIAVWTRTDGATRSTIEANRYVAGVGWETAGPIGADTGSHPSPAIAMDAHGNAVAVWVAEGTTWANRYVAGGGWGTAGPIQTNPEKTSSAPQVAMDANGNALAVWIQVVTDTPPWPGGPTRIAELIVNRYTTGVGWGTATPIGGAGVGADVPHVVAPRMAMTAGGDAIIAWGMCVDTSCGIYVQSYMAEQGATWLSTGMVSNLYGLDIAMSARGDAILVWTDCSDLECNPPNLWADRYSVDAGLLIGESHQPIGTGAKGQVPDMAMDAAGNALVVWTQGSSTRSTIMARRYIAGTGWETAAVVGTDPAPNPDPQIAMDASGNAIAVWTHWDGVRANIWANQFQ